MEYDEYVQAEPSLKPLIGMAVQEAVKLAFVDSVIWPGRHRPDGGLAAESFPTDEERERWRADVDSIPEEVLATASPSVVARNAAVRLLGPGGWYSRGVYAGNVPPDQLLHACVPNATKGPLADVIESLVKMGIEPESLITDTKQIDREVRSNDREGE